MVKARNIVGGIVIALLMATVPTPAHAQQSTEQLVALLEQIAQLTQLVLALQAQLVELENSNTAAAVNIPVDEATREIVLPVDIYLLSSPYETVRAQTTVPQIREMFIGTGGVNDRFWKQANITWNVRNVRTHVVQNKADQEYYLATITGDQEGAFNALPKLMSGATVNDFTVFVAHSFATIEQNGLYSGASGVAIISETNDRQSGVDYMGYLFAHELGHVLGLRHEGNEYNLMHPGKRANTIPRQDRVVLTPTQIETARAQASTGGPARGY